MPAASAYPAFHVFPSIRLQSHVAHSPPWKWLASWPSLPADGSSSRFHCPTQYRPIRTHWSLWPFSTFGSGNNTSLIYCDTEIFFSLAAPLRYATWCLSRTMLMVDFSSNLFLRPRIWCPSVLKLTRKKGAVNTYLSLFNKVLLICQMWQNVRSSINYWQINLKMLTLVNAIIYYPRWYNTG